jgi:hypothetical protein
MVGAQRKMENMRPPPHRRKQYPECSIQKYSLEARPSPWSEIWANEYISTGPAGVLPLARTATYDDDGNVARTCGAGFFCHNPRRPPRGIVVLTGGEYDKILVTGRQKISPAVRLAWTGGHSRQRPWREPEGYPPTDISLRRSVSSTKAVLNGPGAASSAVWKTAWRTRVHLHPLRA